MAQRNTFVSQIESKSFSWISSSLVTCILYLIKQLELPLQNKQHLCFLRLQVPISKSSLSKMERINLLRYA